MIKEESAKLNQSIETVLKSNSGTLKLFMANNLRSMQDEIRDIVNTKSFQDKITLLFKYYKPRGNEDTNTITSKKILNKFPLTKMLTEIIFSVADNIVKCD
jgi:hypothetical protein